MKMIDLSKSVYEITEEYPEIIEIMVGLGFTDMRNPIVRKTAGKIMTISLGCKMKGIPLEEVIAELEKAGYIVINN